MNKLCSILQPTLLLLLLALLFDDIALNFRNRKMVGYAMSRTPFNIKKQGSFVLTSYTFYDIYFDIVYLHL